MRPLLLCALLLASFSAVSAQVHSSSPVWLGQESHPTEATDHGGKRPEVSGVVLFVIAEAEPRSARAFNLIKAPSIILPTGLRSSYASRLLRLLAALLVGELIQPGNRFSQSDLGIVESFPAQPLT